MEMKTAISCTILRHTKILIAVGVDRKSGSAGMPRPSSYAVFCLKKKIGTPNLRAAGDWSRYCRILLRGTPTVQQDEKKFRLRNKCNDELTVARRRGVGLVADERYKATTPFTGDDGPLRLPLDQHQVLLLSAANIFFFNDTATTEIYTLSLHDALPI